MKKVRNHNTGKGTYQQHIEVQMKSNNIKLAKLDTHYLSCNKFLRACAKFTAITKSQRSP